MLEELKKEVLEANIALVKNGLVKYTWGNVSGIDKTTGYVVIKPSGVDYALMKASDMVVVDLDGNVIEGNYKPSSDTPTHLELYKAYKELGGIVHTHSTYATAFAQGKRDIPCYGTTHADYFYGSIPCSRPLLKEDMDSYELNTGKKIIETMSKLDIQAIPACLVAQHGVFAWGKNASEAVYHATVVEEVAKMAYVTETLCNPNPLPEYILDKHYHRKHGKNAYYGQEKK